MTPFWHVSSRNAGATGVPVALSRSGVGVALGGLLAGLLATVVAGDLSPTAAPLAMLIILTSTLVAGRIAPIHAAMAHGACAWGVIAGASHLVYALPPAWPGSSAWWISLALIEDMALIGHVGFVRRRATRLSLDV